VAGGVGPALAAPPLSAGRPPPGAPGVGIFGRATCAHARGSVRSSRRALRAGLKDAASPRTPHANIPLRPGRADAGPRARRRALERAAPSSRARRRGGRSLRPCVRSPETRAAAGLDQRRLAHVPESASVGCWTRPDGDCTPFGGEHKGRPLTALPALREQTGRHRGAPFVLLLFLGGTRRSVDRDAVRQAGPGRPPLRYRRGARRSRRRSPC
jgi:hypothetical protein